MSKFSELRDLQCQLISQLKGREYKDLLSMPSANDYQLDNKFKNFSLVIHKYEHADHLEILVVFKDSSEVELPEFFTSLVKDNNLSLGGSSSIDGFDIYPDGHIVDKHPDVFDGD